MRLLELGPCRARALNGVLYTPSVPFEPPLALKGRDGALAVLIKVNPLLYRDWEALAATGAKTPVAAMQPPLRVLAEVGGGPEWVLLHDVMPYAMGAPTHFGAVVEAAAMDPAAWLGIAGSCPDAEARAPHSSQLFIGGKPLAVFANLPKVREIRLQNIETFQARNADSVAMSVAAGAELAPKTSTTFTRKEIEMSAADALKWKGVVAKLNELGERGSEHCTTKVLNRGKLTSKSARMLMFVAPRLNHIDQVWLPKLIKVTRVETDYESGVTVVQVELEDHRRKKSSVWLHASALSTMYRRLTDRFRTQIDIRHPQDAINCAKEYQTIIEKYTSETSKSDDES